MCTLCFITYHHKQKSSTSIKTTQTELIHMIPHKKKKKTLHLTPLKLIMEPENGPLKSRRFLFGNTIIFRFHDCLFPMLLFRVPRSTSTDFFHRVSRHEFLAKTGECPPFGIRIITPGVRDEGITITQTSGIFGEKRWTDPCVTHYGSMFLVDLPTWKP